MPTPDEITTHPIFGGLAEMVRGWQPSADETTEAQLRTLAEFVITGEGRDEALTGVF
ncbi:MAG: hypothetical protein FWE61_11640 [Micrococcales bacterium]|nr:hypothetical protein [Micrococcales bacterium]